VGLLFVWTQPIHAQESAGFEKIRDVSPEGKFGVRVFCSSEPEDPNDIDSNLITAVDLVSLASKKVVMSIGQNEGGSAPDLIWSGDSEWFAFPLSEGHRVTDTYVYHHSDDDFSRIDTEGLRVAGKGGVRNEYVNPVRWIKPGVLLL
jgi:hypothetical protein